jgi:hypothetical protein
MIPKVIPKLNELRYEPSSHQMACAVTTFLLFGQHKRQIISIPPGKGKSRVVCAISALFQRTSTPPKRIFIAFSSKILYDTDREVYESLNLLLHGIEVKPVVGTKAIAD